MFAKWKPLDHIQYLPAYEIDAGDLSQYRAECTLDNEQAGSILCTWPYYLYINKNITALQEFLLMFNEHDLYRTRREYGSNQDESMP